ncbi:hypothetical protein K3759_10075 [Sulfitobacter sp. W027]|uniref:hypothetical protein n=1 Tax=Sulfitobacter sp. W027 TaxID=2867025 RepID=UPI0021A39A77|nr:hypothetical protein [Sulfitobacter sp. W027]UWR32312.1 hypothetical protein K3759_10075 [Sulfitobacter sp. W027]
MTYTVKLTTTALTGFMFAASLAQAQEAKSEAGDMPMTDSQHMRGDMADMKGMEGMEGMMPMMKMMAEMGPMMENCNKMMQSMNEHMETHHPEDQKG